jgi:hypothetical protein
MKQVAKSGRKVKAITLLFADFGLFFKNEISAKNGRKVKAISLLYCSCWPLFQK